MEQSNLIKVLLKNTNINFLLGAGTSFRPVEGKEHFPLMSDLLKYIKSSSDVLEFYNKLREEISIPPGMGSMLSGIYDTYLFAVDANVEKFLSVLEGVDLYIVDDDFKKEVEEQRVLIRIETFESIIKEGRKFGVFLTMATQRPSDITPTLLSQSHNYVIHKLVNPRDIEIMKNTVPYIDEMSISMLSILSPGQAIFSGTAFNRPNTVQVKFDESITKVESDTIRLMHNWRRKKNFDEESLAIARKDVERDRELSAILGWETSIASDELECKACGEKYICIDKNHAPVGMCLKCGEINCVVTCVQCGRSFIIDTDVIVDEPVYCEDCSRELF